MGQSDRILVKNNLKKHLICVIFVGCMSMIDSAILGWKDMKGKWCLINRMTKKQRKSEAVSQMKDITLFFIEFIYACGLYAYVCM